MNWWVFGPLLFCTICWVLFLVRFTRRAKWWKNPYGVNNFSVSMLVFFILIRLDALQIWPHLKPSNLWGFILYSGGGLLAIHRTVLMERTQNEYNRHETTPHPHRRWDDPK